MTLADTEVPTTEESIAAQDEIVSGFLDGADDSAGEGQETTAPETTEDAAVEETPAEETTTTPPPETPAPAPEAKVPDWSKPVQKLQQDLSNTSKKLDEILGMLKANPTPANKAAAAEMQQQADELAEIERQLDDPNFDPYTASPKVMKTLTAKVRALQAVQDQSNAAKAQEKQAATQRDQFWSNWTQENPGIDGQSLWQQATAEIEADPAFAPEDRLGAAKLLWNQKLRAAKTAPAKVVTSSRPPVTPPKKSPSPATSSGGRMAPPGAREVRPGKAVDPLGQYPDPTQYGLMDDLT